MPFRHANAARCACLLLAASAALATATGASTCPDLAAVSQPPTSTTGGWQSCLSEWSVLGGPADNYETDGPVEAVTWWGFLDDPGGDANPKSFRLTFFTLDGVSGLPCMPEHEYDVQVVPQATGELYDGAPLFAFHATLQPPCPLRRGWIVIEGTAANPSRPFYWISGAPGDHASALRAWWGLWYWVGDLDLALCLETATCEGDVDGDGAVDAHDLMAVLDQWNAAGGPADVNGDGTVNVLDALAVLAAWGPCP
jgi:hypothetical protein